MSDREKIESITKEDFVYYYWCDKDTFYCDIEMNDNIKNLLKDIIEDEDCSLYAEYWKDDDSFHYCLVFGYESVSVADRLECEYLNNLVLNFANKKVGV